VSALSPADVPDLADEEAIAAVSFVRGGFQVGGTVHRKDTFAYLPRAIAEWDGPRQVAELGARYWVQGIRPGLPPASETYLAEPYRSRVKRDRRKGEQQSVGG
jgi:hypothetical protein